MKDFIDGAEYKIRRYRLEHTILGAPSILAMLSMFPLVILCALIGRVDLFALFSVLSFGTGIYFFILSRTITKLKELRKELQKAEQWMLSGNGLSGNDAPTAPVDGAQGIWRAPMLMPDGTGETFIHAARKDGVYYVTSVAGWRFFDFWVTTVIDKGKRIRLPRLRREIRSEPSFHDAMSGLADNRSHPIPALCVVPDEKTGLRLATSLRELELLIAGDANFPVMTNDPDLARDITVAAGVRDESGAHGTS